MEELLTRVTPITQYNKGYPLLYCAYNITHSDVIPIDRINIIKDLGILIDEKLTFRDHIHDKINKAYMMFGLTRSSSIAERPRDASCC